MPPEYGEAILHLDAAYTSAVRPGSHVNVFVNGSQHADDDHHARRHRPAAYSPYALKNFSPVSTMLSKGLFSDGCRHALRAGETLSETNRFVLFDTTPLEFPNFGRIGRLPDLSRSRRRPLSG